MGETFMAGSIEIEDLEALRGSFCLSVSNLRIEPREIFAILGSTGSGKTVLLESIAGAFPLNAGTIFLDGKAADTLPIQQRHLGILYQDHALFPHMSVRENVGYGVKMQGYSSSVIDERVDNLLDQFNIRAIADCYPGTISGGESQRVALARALILEPEILLLDEPFSALDPATKKGMYTIMRDVHRKFDCTIIFVTHDFNEAYTLADRVGIILEGRLRAVRKADALFDPVGFEDDIRAFLDLEQAG